MRLQNLFVILSICGLSSISHGQTVTVAKAGTPNFSTLQAAINSFATDPDAGVPNVVEITDSSLYDEVITVNVPVSIIGTGSSRPVLATQNNAGDGIVISIPTGTSNTVLLKNLIVIPSLAPTPTDDGIVTINRNLYLTLDNVLISGNNGSNQPISVDGLTEVAMPGGAKHFGDDATNFGAPGTVTTEGLEVFLKNTVITHNRGTSADGLILQNFATVTTLVSDGCVFSYNGRLGAQAAGNFEINAPNQPVIIAGNKGFAGIWFSGASGSKRTINHAIIVNNGNGTSAGAGIEHQNGGTAGLTLLNSIITGNTIAGVVVADVGTNQPVNINKVTVGKNVVGNSPAISVNAAASANVNLTDSIVVGTGTSDVSNSIVHNGTGTLSLSGTALVTAAPYSLNTGTSGAGPVTGTASTNANPQFVEVANFTSSSFMDVANPAYATANSSNGPLGGGADYVGIATVSSWSLY